MLLETRGDGARAGAACRSGNPERARPDARYPVQEVGRSSVGFPRPRVRGRSRGRSFDPRSPRRTLSRAWDHRRGDRGREPGRARLPVGIDPIDGTANFVNGFPLFAASIGILHRAAGRWWGPSGARPATRCALASITHGSAAGSASRASRWRSRRTRRYAAISPASPGPAG